MTKARQVYVTRLKKDLQYAIQDCKLEYKACKSRGDWNTCIDLEARIDAYEFVRDELLHPMYDEEK
jgi:hypothetical protein